MRLLQASQTKLQAAGVWVAENPQRLKALLMVLTAVVTFIAIVAGVAHPGVLVGPSSEGGSGGG
jgi:hypothetical protein